MKIVEEIKEAMGSEWIPLIYKDKIRVQRTRSYTLDVSEKQNQTIIQHTLLGVELKVRKTRFSCPDLSAARYLQVFAWIGCRKFAIPYDITKISGLADELESSWHKMLLLSEKLTKIKSPQTRGRIKAALAREIRKQIYEIGAGQKMPEFKKSTKQR